MYFGVVSTQVFFMNHFFFFFFASFRCISLQPTLASVHCFISSFCCCLLLSRLFVHLFLQFHYRFKNILLFDCFSFDSAVASIHFRFSSNENGRFQSVASINFVIHIINSRNFYNIVNNRMRNTCRFFLLLLFSLLYRRSLEHATFVYGSSSWGMASVFENLHELSIASKAIQLQYSFCFR